MWKLHTESEKKVYVNFEHWTFFLLVSQGKKIPLAGFEPDTQGGFVIFTCYIISMWSCDYVTVTIPIIMYTIITAKNLRMFLNSSTIYQNANKPLCT